MFHILVLLCTFICNITSAQSRRYVSQVGASSLASLLLGSAILVFVAINIPSFWSEPTAFTRGSHLPVQFWLAVLGVGFSLLAYGLSESYVHLFDVWCTRKAGSASGLDYARYLNTQPRAPVVIGLRGFRQFVVLRYLVVLLGIAGSIGYKFAIVQITDMSLELDETSVTVNLPSTEPIDLGTGATSPWLRDGPTVEASRAFLHYSTVDGRHTNITTDAMDRRQPPGAIFMSGEGDCSDTFHKFDEGVLTTLELVTVANMELKHGDSDDFVELVPGGWTRIARSAVGWLDGGSKGLVIDYQNEQNGTLRIRWAEIPEWADEERGTIITRQPITRSIRYTIGLTLAEVSRVVSSQGCWKLKEVLPFESEISTIPLWPPAMQNENFIAMILKDPRITILDGVGLIVRNSMNLWSHAIHASESPRYNPGHAPVPSQPSRWALLPPNFNGTKGRYLKPSYKFAEVCLTSNVTGQRDLEDPSVPQIYSWEFRPHFGDMVNYRYPYYDGTNVQNAGVGAYRQAGIFFIALSVAACLLVVFRLYLGPAGLTSWMGQHVYLALEGKVEKEGSEILACGHRVAHNLGTIRIGEPVPDTGKGKRRIDPGNYSIGWVLR